jgi:hypothetical protein
MSAKLGEAFLKAVTLVVSEGREQSRPLQQREQQPTGEIFQRAAGSSRALFNCGYIAARLVTARMSGRHVDKGRSRFEKHPM